MKITKILICLLFFLLMKETFIAQNEIHYRHNNIPYVTRGDFSPHPYLNPDKSEIVTSLISATKGNYLNERNDYYLDSTSTNIENSLNVDRKKYNLHLNIGFPELIGLGFGYQNSDEWSYVFNLAVINKGGEGSLISGTGIRFARFFSTNLPFNNIYVQPTVILLKGKRHFYRFGPLGLSFEAGIGSDSIKKSGLGFFWSLGGVVYIIDEDKPFFSPSFKLGLKLNI